MRALVALIVLASSACAGDIVEFDAGFPVDVGSIDSRDAGIRDADVPDAPSEDAQPADSFVPPECVVVTSETIQTQQIGSETVTARSAGSACARTFELESTATLRDHPYGNPRNIGNFDRLPHLQSGSVVFDALFALAMQEVTDNSVDWINDDAFDNGARIPCPPGGCFQTGRLWSYVWTRDTAYAADLALAAIDPKRAANSLIFKVSTRRDGTDLQIVQDTGTGGSYPVSTDRVTWAFGAEAVLNHLPEPDRTEFRDVALEALQNTIEHDRRVVFDANVGLYNGESSFLDWREQSYPAWVAEDVVHIASAKSLSTNLAHLKALRLAERLSSEVGDGASALRYGDMSRALESSILASFPKFDLGDGAYSAHAAMFGAPLDPVPIRRGDALASALLALSGVAGQTSSISGQYPVSEHGPIVTWPAQQNTPIYHNRSVWPFVTAYMLRAARRERNSAAVSANARSLYRAAALNLSNMENFEMVSGAPWVEDGAASGPVVNSQAQLWSVAGYISFVLETIFGIEVDELGIRLNPGITTAIHSELLSGSGEVALNGLRLHGNRVVLHFRLPPVGMNRGFYRVTSVRLNEQLYELGEHIPISDLSGDNYLEVVLDSPANDAEERVSRIDPSEGYQALFGPKTPSISSVTVDQGLLRLSVDLAEEAPADVSYSVYGDGALLEENRPGSLPTFVDQGSADYMQATRCYTVSTKFVASGNDSQHSRPVCFWGPNLERITSYLADSFEAVGGSLVDRHGRLHYEGWGDEGHRLTVRGVSPSATGRFWLELEGSNGAGGFTNGITCAVKRLRVVDQQSGTELLEDYLLIPHTSDWGRWGPSNQIPVRLEAGRTYDVIVDSDLSSVNMSAFSHFARYTAGTGGPSAFNRVNISALKLLYRGP